MTKLREVVRQATGMIGVLLLVVFPTGAIMAQQAAPPEQPSQAAQPLPADQLDNLVAPIALYPDPLVSQVLVASTYPLEVVEAEQWLRNNGNLKGQPLMDAARQQNWDASVQALVAFPDVLANLTHDVAWMTALGDAFLAQQADVMAAVQRMRARAQANGKLASTPQQTVTTETQGGQTAIEIAPADPQVIYVPQYNPMYVWGPPAWGYYPPLDYYGYGYGFGPGIDLGYCFGGWGGWGWGGWGWGWGPNWFGRSVFVNALFFNHYGFRGGVYAGGFGGRTGWQHDPSHRLGVAYPNRQLAGRYQAGSLASRSAMARPGGFNSARQGGAGNWSRFGSAATPAQGYRGTAPQSTGRATGGQWQHFQGTQGSSAPAQRYAAPAQRYAAPAQRYAAPAQRYSAPAQRYAAPAQRYSAPAQQYAAPAQRYSAPAQRYSAPAQRYSAPAQRYSAPAQQFQSAPRMSAPSYGGGSGGSGGGGGSRSSSGSHSSGGSGSHGGGHR
jgi:uncharacterized membrane protein YgcG